MKDQTANANRQRMERERDNINRKKESLELFCSNSVVNLLRRMRCDCVNVIASKNELHESEHGLSGTIKIKCSFIKANTNLEKEYDINVNDDALVLPSEENVEKDFPATNIVNHSIVTSSIAEIPDNSLSIQNKSASETTALCLNAEKILVDTLKAMKYEGVKVIKVNSDSVKKVSGMYDGTINFMVSLIDKKGEKKVVIPMKVAKTVITTPMKEIMQVVIAKTKTAKDLIVASTEQEVADRYKAIDEEEKAREEATLKSLEFIPTEVSGSQVEPIKVQANAHVFSCKVLKVNKTMLSEETKVGDIIDVEGLKYEVTDDTDSKLSDKGSGSIWTLVKVESTDKADQKDPR